MKISPNKYNHLPFVVGSRISHTLNKETEDETKSTFHQEVWGYRKCDMILTVPFCTRCEIKTLVVVNGTGFRGDHVWCMGHGKLSWRVDNPTLSQKRRYNRAKRKYWNDRVEKYWNDHSEE